MQSWTIIILKKPHVHLHVCLYVLESKRIWQCRSTKYFGMVHNNFQLEYDPVGFRFCSLLFRALCLFPNFCFRSFSSLLLPFILVPCLVLSLRSTFPFFDRSSASSMRGAAQWEKPLHEQLDSASRCFLPSESQPSRLNVWPPSSTD